jgi:hypothetical protein
LFGLVGGTGKIFFRGERFVVGGHIRVHEVGFSPKKSLPCKTPKKPLKHLPQKSHYHVKTLCFYFPRKHHIPYPYHPCKTPLFYPGPKNKKPLCPYRGRGYTS